MSQGRTVVTIDGLAGTGKTTIAKLLAERLNFYLLNSGLLYRAVGLLGLEAGVDSLDHDALNKLLSSHTVFLGLDYQGLPVVNVDDRSFTSEQLQDLRVSQAASKYSSNPIVRDFLKLSQRDAFPGQPLVAEGRDMGTLIFPDASIKFFVETPLAERAERRVSQLLESESNVTLKHRNDLKKQVEQDISERDERDTVRSLAPTVPADDAIIINNSGQTLTQVLESMYDSVASKGLV